MEKMSEAWGGITDGHKVIDHGSGLGCSTEKFHGLSMVIAAVEPTGTDPIKI